MAVSVRDVAQAAGVSLGTVSNVLNTPSKVAPNTVAKVQAAIDELGFVRNDAARQLRAGRSRSIGLIVPDVGNPFFAAVARGAEAAAQQQNLAVLVASSDEVHDRENNLLGLFEEQRVRGVLVSPMEEDLQHLRAAKKRGTPVVLVDRKAKDFSSVSVDDIAGGYLAVKHLIDCGRKKLAFVGGPLSIQQISDRLSGANKAVSEHPGVTIEVIEIPSLTVHAGRALGAEIKKYDGVFAANDLVAIGIMQACVMDGGISIPQDLSLIGYDDIDFSSAAIVALTSIRQPSAQIGASAVELLMQYAEGGKFRSKNIEFQPELIVRDSTRR